MFKNFIAFAWLGLIFCYVVGYYLLFRELHLAGRLEWVLWPGLLGLVLWIYVTARFFIFRRRLISFLKNIIAGEYETGIKAHRFMHDEVAELTGLFNKVADRLRLYDVLRAEKVAINTRAREVMFAQTRAAVIVADVDERMFHFNPAAQGLFAVEQEEMSFASIEKRPENAAFVEFFRDTIEREKVPREADVALTIPIRATTKGTHALIVPIKDREEKVRLALIFLK
jgi:nitrogen fixation/metabolism regulation signal transduction histidine kinase